MYVYIYIYVYLSIDLSVCIYMYIYTPHTICICSIYLYLYMYLYTHMCVYTHLATDLIDALAACNVPCLTAVVFANAPVHHLEFLSRKIWQLHSVFHHLVLEQKIGGQLLHSLTSKPLVRDVCDCVGATTLILGPYNLYRALQSVSIRTYNNDGFALQS